MSSVRFRLFLLLIITSGSVGASGYLTWTSYEKYRSFNRGLAQSYYLQDKISSLNALRFDKDTSTELQTHRASLTPQHRMEALSHIIQAYNDRNPSLLNKRRAFFEKVEQEYRSFVRPQITYLESRITYYGSICLISTLVSLFLTLIYVQRSVFRPLKDLSQKMVDFLNQKYTYQFSVPEPNEVGHLQGTFNAMAQRVLTNMEELKALDQAKSEFLSIASHELRTPLTSIKGSLSLLKSGIVGEMNEAAANLMTIALTETDRLIRLINDLLDLAKIEARKFPLNCNWTPLSGLVESTFQSLQGLASTAEVELVAQNHPPVEVYMDSDRIRQVLTNLLSNAIKYSPKGAQVHLDAFTDDRGLLWMEITDEGRGIAPEDQELIFQKFRQATSPQNPLVKGTGLGLAIAKALIEEHGGEIGVRSTPGEGSTFYFSLPKWKFSKASFSQAENNETDEGLEVAA